MRWFGVFAAGVVFWGGLGVPHASALTAEVANKCRQYAVKAYPPTRVGSKKGTAGAERQYFKDCVAKDGNVPAPEGPVEAQEPKPTGSPK
jgi:hypothetical protein